MKTTRQKNLMLVPLLAGLAITAASALGQSADGLDRTVLPIREPQYPTSTVLDARDAKAPTSASGIPAHLADPATCLPSIVWQPTA